MKKLLSLLVVLVLFLSTLPYSVNAQDSLTINTPEDYINYLKNNNKGLNSLNDNDSSAILKQFTSLSKEDQQKFVNYMNDPDAIKSIFNGIKSGKDSDLYNGDIKVRVDQNKQEHSTAPLAAEYTHYSETVVSTFGINIITTQVYIHYRVSGGKVTEILNGGGVVTRNWFPVVNVTIKEEKPYINSDKRSAYQTAYFTWNFIHPSLGEVVETGTHTIWGYADGTWESQFLK
ncbi:hypothetical protein P4H61_23390 [Paenibacillus peoriae]|uniref:hypothetical protein n=1 Tax=Paenibacillus peoriae TaxID=59893 RepID=UPI00026C641E|nr:hypothetical protein [Paenibacillus peoriae]MEC0184432.1 hypothetical protein [Paenibacillus peoriae]